MPLRHCPFSLPGCTPSRVVWVGAALWLGVLAVVVGGHWLRHPTVARSHARNPQMAHFYGAAPMALLTVAGGSVLVGGGLIGEHRAITLAWVLWIAGTVGGLFTAVSIPYLLFTQHNVEPDAAFGGWLMPVVPHGLGGHRRTAHRSPITGHRAADHAVRVLGDVRAVSDRRVHHHHDDLESLGLFRNFGNGRVPTLWIVLGPWVSR